MGLRPHLSNERYIIDPILWYSGAALLIILIFWLFARRSAKEEAARNLRLEEAANRRAIYAEQYALDLERRRAKELAAGSVKPVAKRALSVPMVKKPRPKPTQQTYARDPGSDFFETATAVAVGTAVGQLAADAMQGVIGKAADTDDRPFESGGGGDYAGAGAEGSWDSGSSDFSSSSSTD